MVIFFKKCYYKKVIRDLLMSEEVKYREILGHLEEMEKLPLEQLKVALQRVQGFKSSYEAALAAQRPSLESIRAQLDGLEFVPDIKAQLQQMVVQYEKEIDNTVKIIANLQLMGTLLLDAVNRRSAQRGTQRPN